MHILPVPVHYEIHEPVINIVNGDAATVVTASIAESDVAHYLRAHLTRCSLDTAPNKALAKLEISLRITQSKVASFDHLSNRHEAYELIVRKASSGQGVITITSPAAQGLFWGVQSLLQLLAWPDGVSGQDVLRLRSLRILDYPRFMYRGALLDVGRHWYAVYYTEAMLMGT